MRNIDIFLQIMFEATSLPREQLESLTEYTVSIFGRKNLYVEVPDEEARELIASLRQELPAIKAHLVSIGLLDRSRHQGTA